MDAWKFSMEGLRSAAPMIFAVARSERSMESLRRRLCFLAEQMEYDTFYDYGNFREGSIIRVRDCARVFRNLLKKRSEDLSGFSVAKVLKDVASERPRSDLSRAFYADMYYLLLGLQGYGPGKAPVDEDLEISRQEGRPAALERSSQLDRLGARMERYSHAYPHGLDTAIVAYREQRRKKILHVLGGASEHWWDWKWQVRHVIRKLDQLERLVELKPEERESVEAAVREKIPFGITPYYLSLMDEGGSDRDRSIRAQVIPPLDYVRYTAEGRRAGGDALDFMRERDTSPVDLVTRRYPGIVIFKPFNTCPQICVYCQRNWEIERAMDPAAWAGWEKVERALEWIRNHPTIHEVLLTGGDPLAMSEGKLKKVMQGIASIPTVERIRVGTRTLATVPMRITDRLAELLESFRVPGKREVVVVTHVQHPYEVTPEMVQAVERLRARCIPVYNQLVYTFWVSRRFEAATLRRILRRVGIVPYYTFNTKGKEETRSYRVPMARLLQEQKEEARLLPGMARTDEAVYNVPGMGKNYLRGRQHRSILSILPDGSRVYEYHPWEKNISGSQPLDTFITKDVPILEYLERLEALGEDPSEYETIWYYY